jgi:hypothetical protein
MTNWYLTGTRALQPGEALPKGIDQPFVARNGYIAYLASKPRQPNQAAFQLHDNEHVLMAHKDKA